MASPLFVQGNGVHNGNACKDGSKLTEHHLQGRLGQQLGEHIDSGDVDEATSGEGDDPGHHRAGFIGAAEEEAKESAWEREKKDLGSERRRREKSARGWRHTENGAEGSQDLRGNGLLFAEASLDQDGKVANLVWDLMEEDRNCGRNSELVACHERRGDGHAISEVVGRVGNQVEESANELLWLHFSIFL